MNDSALRLEARRAEDTARSIRQAISALDRVVLLTPNVDLTDPDLLSETLKRAKVTEHRKADQERKRKRHEAENPPSKQYDMDDDRPWREEQ